MDALATLSDQLAAAVERSSPAVVAVHGRPRIASTGIHWRPGLIVTANHTVETDDEVRVTTSEGHATAATIAGRDVALDVAVLRIDAPGIAVANVGDSSRVRVGQMVLAVGVGPRASWGVVSAIGAAWSRRAESDLFSVDLTLYPGFSGGPLVDARGVVIGLNTSGASRQMQLTIPANAVAGVVDAVERHGRIPRAWLGVGTQQVRVPESARSEDAGRTALIVTEVQPGSPAAASLFVGDVILSLDGTRVHDPLDLRALVRPERIGQRVTASIVRAGRLVDVDLTIAERPHRARR